MDDIKTTWAGRIENLHTKMDVLRRDAANRMSLAASREEAEQFGEIISRIDSSRKLLSASTQDLINISTERAKMGMDYAGGSREYSAEMAQIDADMKSGKITLGEFADRQAAAVRRYSENIGSLQSINGSTQERAARCIRNINDVSSQPPTA